MKRGFTCTRGCAVLAGFAAAAALSAAALRASAATGRQRAAGRLAAAEAALTAQVRAASDYSGARLRQMRAEARRFELRIGQADTVDQLKRLLAPRWKIEAASVDERGPFSTWLGTYRLEAPAAGDWSGIVEAIGQAEALPGSQVRQFEMRAGGDRPIPNIVLVRVVVAIRTRTSPSTATFP
jgi:hypothetical protein